MANKLQVILLEDLDNLGQAGDIVDVSEGYARNYLFVQGKAALATVGAKKKVEREKMIKAKDTQEDLVAKQQKAESLTGTELTFVEKVKEGEQIYGKITAARVAKELNKQANLDLKAKDVILSQELTRLGTYDVTVSLSREVETVIKVTIVGDPSSMATQETND